MRTALPAKSRERRAREPRGGCAAGFRVSRLVARLGVSALLICGVHTLVTCSLAQCHVSLTKDTLRGG